MTTRHILLCYRNRLHPALHRELVKLGLELRDCRDWHEIPDSDRSMILGCFIWFYDCIRHPINTLRLKRFLRQNGIPLFAWNQDAPHYLNRAKWRLDWLNSVRLLDVYATHTLADTTRSFADLQLYLPNAADTLHYHLNGKALVDLRNPDIYEYDVSFFGAMNGEKYKEMRNRQAFFSALATRLSEAGIRYHFCEAQGMTTDEQIAMIQRSRINLNFGASCEFGFTTGSGLPERCYGIPAVGGFLLCDKRTHAMDDFSVGKNWAEFDGLDDCVEKIKYWLVNFDQARLLAERCFAHVVTTHTYAQRAEELRATLVSWHAGKRGLIR